jgi:plasmid stabilization system protein ParE
VRVVWSPLAVQRVSEAAVFIALDKPEAARGWAEATFAAVARLEQHPESGRVVPELGRQEVREIVHGAFRIIYRIEPERVLILTVRRAAQLLDPAEAQ